MRDLLMAGFLFAYLVFAFRSPFAGYLLWGWGGLVALNSYLFGFMQGLPYVQIFAIVTLLVLVLQKDKQIKLEFNGNATSWLMILFVLHGLFSATLAYPGLERNWELWGNVAKTVLFCLLMPLFSTTRYRIHAVVVMIVIGTSFHGVLDGLKFLSSGGAHNAQVIEKFGDNNHLAMVLVMILPLIYYLQHYSKRLWMRAAFLSTMLVVVLAVVSTDSRGGLLGLAAVAAWLLYKSRHRIWGLLIVSICTGILLFAAPADWKDRMSTIQSANEDASFLTRVVAWKVSAAIAQEHPIFGGGFRAVQSYPVWDRFKNSPSFLDSVTVERELSYAPAAHSIWFEVLGDLGILGLIIFSLLIMNAFWTAQKIKRISRDNGPTQQWALDLANLTTITLIAYVVTGSALSAAYFELPYVCIMLLETIRQQQVAISNKLSIGLRT